MNTSVERKLGEPLVVTVDDDVKVGGITKSKLVIKRGQLQPELTLTKYAPSWDVSDEHAQIIGRNEEGRMLGVTRHLRIRTGENVTEDETGGVQVDDVENGAVFTKSQIKTITSVEVLKRPVPVTVVEMHDFPDCYGEF